MKIHFTFEDKDLQAIQLIVGQNISHPFVMARIQRNVLGEPPDHSEGSMWQVLISCLLTTQQKSGPGSPISRFIDQQPFPLNLEKCRKIPDLEKYTYQALYEFGGIRFAPKISAQIQSNFHTLERGSWKTLEEWAHRLTVQRLENPLPGHYALERQGALVTKELLTGIGPKQSRNFWQELGLMRYEFVLDSRILKWLKKQGFPIPLSSASLGEDEIYHFISDILRDLCTQAGMLPCILDAAIFASYDRE